MRSQIEFAISDAVTRTKADPNRSRREDQLVAEIERLREALAGGTITAGVRSYRNDPRLFGGWPMLKAETIEAWRLSAQDADTLGVVKPGQFDWPWVVLSLIAEWEKNNADLLTTPLPDRPVRPAR